MKKILITSRPWERRIAIIENNLIQNLYFDSKTSLQLERSFFKGKVAKILVGVQTAFIDINQPKAGFLHISEIDRELAFKKMSGIDDDEIEEENNRGSRYDIQKLDIGEIIRQGEDILVQVSKEPINEKGAKLTTCFTLPGRFVILMPNIPKIGVSKKIMNLDERKRLKDIVLSVLPDTAGCIIRTVCEGRSDNEIEKDIKYLLNVWNSIQKRFVEAKSEECIYEDIDLTLQVVRDNLDESIESIICDDQEAYNMVSKFVGNIFPEYSHRILLYNGKTTLFDEFQIEDKIQKALQSKVELQNGGSIVIDSTEAMTVIDVNTAKFIGSTKLEDTLLKTNLEAAKEIVRQLKLRNIGGLVVIDFIDMRTAVNRNKLFSFFEKTLKEEDRSQSVVLKISEFGLVQMTRKRTGKTLRQQLLNQCKHCRGQGVTISLSERIHEIFRKLEKTLLSKRPNANTCYIVANQKFCDQIIEIEYDTLLFFEKKYKINIVIKQDNLPDDVYNFEWSTGVS